MGDASQFTEALHQAEIAANKDFTDLFSSTTPLGLLSLAAWGLGYFGQPHILARFMAAYSVKSLIKSTPHKYDMDGDLPSWCDWC